MGLRNNIKKILVIGSGPIVIGQAAEFDYAGTQACTTLKSEGIEVVLINSNPATIMTDKNIADKIYIEPLNIDVVKKIIEIEKPDSLLSTIGGQTGLTLAMQLAKEGFLDKHNVKLLGANPETIDKAEDRQTFKETMQKISQPCIPSKVVHDIDSAIDFAKSIGYPVIIRPAFTLGGSGGGIAHSEKELIDIAINGLRLSPITQILVEKCISGWKEIEFEVIRDSKENVITVCSMENLDPVGIHTGDSIVVAPAVTLSDKEYQMLRTAAINIISELKVEGGCNCQFALNPNSFEYAVIEVNPRVSRSSALASKATGYPIAKVSTKIAIGYTLDEIINQVTNNTYACFEPALDYIVVKFPKWPFDKFVYAKRTLGPQMKATGEVMAIASNFEQAIMKAVRGAELGLDSLNLKKLSLKSDEEIKKLINNPDDERLFVIFEAIKRNIVTLKEIHKITLIDMWFLSKLKNLVDLEKELANSILIEELYEKAKLYGYLDSTIKKLSKQDLPYKKESSYKMVDTCAAEFDAQTPYFYSSFEKEDEASLFINKNNSNKQKVIIIGSGPIRIGQGIEFDYCCVHSAWALKSEGYEAIICNNNPETVSTDFNTGDRLYFDPLTFEDVLHIINIEKPYGVIIQFGGQTAIKLAKDLHKNGIKILGSDYNSIDQAEDREKFDDLLERCNIKRPKGYTVFNTEDAIKIANKLEYPVLIRPSYVLGGQNMIIAHSDKDIIEYMEIITSYSKDNPILIDKYMMGIEIEVDTICDGKDFLIPGIMEHIERAGVHSGDSISVYPEQNISESIKNKIIEYTKRLSIELKVIGLINIQYIVFDDEVYVIEVNPRSSRTVPYISKVTGVPMVELATKIMLGKSLKDLGFGIGLYKKSEYIAVKVPVFSFEKLHDVDNHLGPEMKSTGEVLGIAKSLDHALYKGLLAAGNNLKKKGGVLITVRDADKLEVVPIAEKFQSLGFELYATAATAHTLNREMVATNVVKKISEGENNVLTLLDNGKISYVISTSSKGREPALDSVKIRRKAVERSIVCLTSLDTANAVVDSLSSKTSISDLQFIDINKI